MNRHSSPKSVVLNVIFLLLLALNLAITLFPVIPVNTDPSGFLYGGELDRVFNFVSSFISPIAMAISIVFYMLWKGGSVTLRNRRILIISLIAFVAILFSLIANPPNESKIVFIAIYFLVANLFIFVVLDSESINAEAALNMLRWTLLVWALSPLVLVIINPAWIDLFFTQSDHGYHGFAQGRPAYGMWIGILIILLLNQPEIRFRKWWLIFSIVALALSQSRAGIGALGVGYVYYLYAKQGKLTRSSITKISVAASAIFVVLVMWMLFGRGEVFTVLNHPRPLLYAAYFDYLSENWLFGFGNMYGAEVPGVFTDAPAHNLVIQYWANFGVMAAVGFLLYWLAIFADVKSTASRMVLIFLFLYGQMEPVQGTANFYAPLPLICFITVVMLRGTQFRELK